MLTEARLKISKYNKETSDKMIKVSNEFYKKDSIIICQKRKLIIFIITLNKIYFFRNTEVSESLFPLEQNLISKERNFWKLPHSEKFDFNTDDGFFYRKELKQIKKRGTLKSIKLGFHF